MKWKKLGLIFCPNNNYEWMFSHAANCFAQRLNEEVFRVYFSTRNNEGKSAIAFVDIEIKHHRVDVVRISDAPVLSQGKPGLFDDSGATVGSIIDTDKGKFLYYLGWNLAVGVPFRNSIGLAIKKDGDSFVKYSEAPVLDRNHLDPYTISYPSVLYDNGVYHMWYGTHLKWLDNASNCEMMHGIRYASSGDGIRWLPHDKISLMPDDKDTAFCRPFVLKEDGIFKMFYSYRDKSYRLGGRDYRIGYAESQNGVDDWQRKDDQIGIDVSGSGWDSEMICYPCIMDVNGERYMLYNGNGYGRSGFGIAILEKN